MKNVENILKPALKNIVPKNCNYADKIRIENIKQLLIDYTSLEKFQRKYIVIMAVNHVDRRF